MENALIQAEVTELVGAERHERGVKPRSGFPRSSKNSVSVHAIDERELRNAAIYTT